MTDLGLTRRDLLRVGSSAAVLASLRWPLAGVARAAADAHLLITVYAAGGWDVTQVLDAHAPGGSIDVDVPGEPPSRLATAGPLVYVSNPVTRPAVDAFFARWAGRAAIVNGLGTRSTSHDQSLQLVFTGSLDPTRADFAVMAAHHRSEGLPLPHLLLDGPTWAGSFDGVSGRIGAQMASVLAYDRIPGPDGQTVRRVVSTFGESRVQAALTRVLALDAADPDNLVAARLASFADAQQRAEVLAGLAGALPDGSEDGAALAASIGAAFRNRLTTSVTAAPSLAFDTHKDNRDQHTNWQRLFAFLDGLVGGLASRPGIVAPTLLEETTVVVCSEFARTPRFNETRGKDHHPFTSMLLIGKHVAPGIYGVTDDHQEGVKIDLRTGRPDDGGTVLDVAHMVAGLLALVGADPARYVADRSPPFTAMIG